MAIYFKALHSFPSFTFSRQKAADNSDSPEHLSGADMVSEMILRFLAEKAVTGAGAGRPDILNMLHSEGLLLGDGKLRKAIQDLKEKGLITVEKGRSGTKITSKGLDYIAVSYTHLDVYKRQQKINAGGGFDNFTRQNLRLIL